MNDNLNLEKIGRNSISKIMSNLQKVNNNNNYFINKISKESPKLKEEIKRLMTKNMSLSVESEEQKKIINMLKNKEKECINLQATITEKTKEIQILNDLLLNERQNFQDDLRKQEIKYENELLNKKREYDTMKHKINNFNKMNGLNDILYAKVLELEKKIEVLKKEEEDKMNNKEIEYTNKIDKYKKRLIDFLKKDKKKDDSETSFSNKLNILHIQELIGEIEFQNKEVNSLLKERKDLKIKILNLSNDVSIYKIMVLILTRKNEDYQKKLKDLYKSIPKSSINKDKVSLHFKSQKNILNTDNNKNINNKEILDKKLKIYSPLLRNKNIFFDLNHMMSKSKTKKNINDTSKNNTNVYNLLPMTLNSEGIETNISKIKTKELISEKKEKEKYKDLFQHYKDKYDAIIKKFKNLFNMYNDTLEKIYNEEIDKEASDIKININDFKDAKFENMTPEQKYSILIKLINNISPLICKKDFEENSFRNKVLKVKQKYNLLDGINQSIFSQTQKSFEINEKNNSVNKNSVNSPCTNTISTYFSPDSFKSGRKKIFNLQKYNINKYNKNYSTLIKYSKEKRHIDLSQDLKIPKFKSNGDGFHNILFTFN